MAAIQHKHSPSRAQGSRRSAHASTKTQSSLRKHRNPKKPKKRERVPESLRFTETKRGKTTVRRYSGRTFYRFEEVKGKPVDLVEVFTAGGYHAIDVRFQDKTALHFAIEPGFILETEYADWKTGNWRSHQTLAADPQRDTPELRDECTAGGGVNTCGRRPPR